MNFKDSSFWAHNQLRIQSGKTPPAHLMLPGDRFGENQSCSEDIFRNQVYSDSVDIPAKELTKEEIRKIHLHCGH